MSKRIYILAVLLIAYWSVAAQQAANRITIGDLTAVEESEHVNVSFRVHIDEQAVGKKETYAFAPVITNEQYRVSLPAIFISGSKTKISRRRRAWAAADTTEVPDTLHAANGQTLNYRTTVRAQQWMHGARLIAEPIWAVCTGVIADPVIVLEEKLHLYDEPQPREVITEIKRFKPQSLADSLSMIFPFVLPESIFDPEDPFKIYDEERDHSMIVYFRQARHHIDKEYRSNSQTMINLVAAIQMILAERSTEVERVVVAGFASPEGSFVFNDRLAFDRAVSVKRYLLENSALTDEQVWLHNGSVDWRGLSLLVDRSDMAQKERILEIIRHTPAIDSRNRPARLEELKSLDGSAPYAYMLEEFFPLLRNGAFIKVYYSNKD